LLSGIASLACEILWLRRLADLLGSDIHAVSVVLAVFFGGMALGGFAVGRIADRLRGAIAVYVCAELLIAVSALAFDPVLEGASQLYARFAPPELARGHALVLKGLFGASVLAVPCLAMGGTLPALARHVARSGDRIASAVGWLYGANTFGAVLGVLGATFVAIPPLGVGASARLAAAVSASAVLAALLGRRVAVGESPVPMRRPTRVWPVAAAFGTGFVSIGLEVLWTRGLSMRFTDGVYSFALVLAAYLLCLAAGAPLARLLERRGRADARSCGLVLVAAGWAGLASPWILAAVPPTARWTGADGGSSHLFEFAAALLVMAGTLAPLGLSFPLLARLASGAVGEVGGGTGAVVAASSAGAVLAALTVPFLALPGLGLEGSFPLMGLLLIATGAAILRVGSAGGAGRRVRTALLTTAVALSGLWLASSASVRIWRAHPDAQLIAHRDGPAASLSVVDEPVLGRTLRLDFDYALGGSGALFVQRRQGLWPYLLQDTARRSLVLGIGTGVTAANAYRASGGAVDALELVPGVISLLPWFTASNDDLPALAARHGDLRLLNVDARHYVRNTAHRYDVVIGDLFLPWRRGAGAMYSREHFAAISGLLGEDGVFWQWLPLHQLDEPELRTIFRTFLSVFPHAEAWWLYLNAERPSIGLVGRQRPHPFDAESLERALEKSPLRSRLLESGFPSAGPILGSWICGRDPLADYAGSGPLNTLDRPVVEFRARRTGKDRARRNRETMLALGRQGRAAVDRAAADAATADLTLRYAEATELMIRSHAATIAGDSDAAVELTGRALLRTPGWGYPRAWLENELRMADMQPSGRSQRIRELLSRAPTRATR
jgi:spermidine synthase